MKGAIGNCVGLPGAVLALLLTQAAPVKAASPAAGEQAPEGFAFVLNAWSASAHGRTVFGQCNGCGSRTVDIGDEVDVGGPEPEHTRVDQLTYRGVRNGVILEYANVLLKKSNGEVHESFLRVQYSGAVVQRRHLSAELLFGVVVYPLASRASMIPAVGLGAGFRGAGDRVRGRGEAVWGFYDTPNKNVNSHFRSWTGVVDYYPFQRHEFLGFRAGYLATNLESEHVQNRTDSHLRFRGPLLGLVLRF